MGRKRKGKSIRNAKQKHGEDKEAEELIHAPHSFIIKRGHVGKNIAELISDMRRLMAPYTATDLKERKYNVLRDFVAVAGPLHVTNIVTFSKTDAAINMKVMRLPRGPTLSFKVVNYSLSRDIVSVLKRPQMFAKQFQHQPLLVLNNFSSDGLHFKLITTMFQNMFPSINIAKIRLGSIRRVVLLNYNSETKLIDFRHFNIRTVPVGVSRGVKKLIQAKVPNMGRFQDFSEYIYQGGNMSESEGEMDGPHNEVTLPEDMPGRGAMKAQKSAVRLTEIGPRMTLQLIKIEDGLGEGEVLFHEFIQKSQEELASIRRMREQKRKLKEQRKQQQEMNVKKKEAMKGAKKTEEEEEDDEVEGEESQRLEEEDDDAEYYREEVGENPDPDLFLGRKPQRDTGSYGAEARRLRRGIKKPRVEMRDTEKQTSREENAAPKGRRNRMRGDGKTETKKKRVRFSTKKIASGRKQKRRR